MAQINAYLNFEGNTREAMAFYKECLGGDLVLQTIEGSPIEDQFPAEARKGILHSTLTKDGLTLMASDMTGPDGFTVGNNVSLMLDCGSEEEVNRLWSSLSEGATILCPLGPAFWGATFGCFTDKFGINWLLHHNAQVPAERKELAGV